MRALVWPLVERRVRRHLPSAMQAPALGDLEEDFHKQVRRRGRAHAEVWLMRESVSLSSAYRADQARR